MSRYETVAELWSAVKKRGIRASHEEMDTGIEHLGLREPFGPEDLDELVSHLSLKHAKKRRIIRLERILARKEWSNAVVGVRLELGLPSRGLSDGNAGKLYVALLDSVLGNQPKMIKIGDGESLPAVQFWSGLVSQARRLCTLLEIDPNSMDNMRAAYAHGGVTVPLGVAKLLHPAWRLEVDGRDLECIPSQVDYLIGHVLWNRPLEPEVMEPKPSVSYGWELLNHESGRFMDHWFSGSAAAARELKQLQTNLKDIKQDFKDGLLITVGSGKSWERMTWKERWVVWNRRYPDFSFQTKDALRKASQRAARHGNDIPA